MYGMYLRKSRADNADETIEETLRKHEKILYDLAASLKINKKEIMQFKEVVSGENIKNRPEMQRLLEYVMNGVFDGVLVVDSQRLARGDTLDQGTIIRAFGLNNTKIITPMKTIDPKNEYDQEYFEFDLFMGRREYKMITRRMQRGRHIAVQEGYYVGSVAPYGYNRVKLEKGYSLEINEDEYNIFKIMKQLALSGEGSTNIANYLNDINTTPRKGKNWSKSSVENILLNETNLGLIKWNSRKVVNIYKDNEIVASRPRNLEPEIFPGKHPAIISQEEFNVIKGLIKSRSHQTGKKKQFKNPLAGLIVCGVCGKKMVRRPYPDRKDALICPTSRCKNISSDLDIVEKRIIEALESDLKMFKKFIDDYSSQDEQFKKDNQLQIEATKKEIEAVRGQITKACEMLEIGAYTVDLFKERKLALDNKIEALEKKKKVLEKETKTSKLEEYKNAVPRIEQAITLYWKTDNPEERNIILKELIESCTYKKTASGRWHPENIDNFDLHIVLKC